MKMDPLTSNKSFQPRPLADLVPELSSILSRESIQTLTIRKQRRTKLALTSTSVKNVKPLTIAEMKADILALKVPSPRKFTQPTTSTKKKTWNSSVKLENKTKSHTGEGQLKHNPVRKVLNFQPKPKALLNPKTLGIPDTPKFTKPEFRPKKSLHVQAKNVVRISGICHMPETPVVNNKPIRNRMTLTNKENFPPKIKINNKAHITPVITKKYIAPCVPITPQSNMSWKSDCDTSFLQKEKEIQDTEDKIKAIAEEPTLENIAEVSPPVSTPFKEYRDVQEFFNHSDNIESSALYNDNTIMSFDKMLFDKENNKREESVIVSLCDLLNKATVINADEPKTELNDLLQIKKQLEHNIQMIEKIKHSQLQSLQSVEKLINEKRTCCNTDNANNNLIKAKTQMDHDKNHNKTSPVMNKTCSAIKSKSPSYKIPKKNQCLRKKILYKSMPNVSNGIYTPIKDMDKRAFNMYMDMKTKDQMSFLNTPCRQKRNLEEPDTPTVTSQNLQMQLDRIYKD